MLQHSDYNPARFDFVSLRLVVACAQTGTLSAAARQCHLVLGAASRRIQELEASLSCSLFDRHARGMALTEEGRAFVRHAISLLHEMDSLVGELADIKKGVSRHIRLCAGTAAINQFLPHLLKRYQSEQPQIQVDLEEQVSEVVVATVRDGRADIGLFVEGPDTTGLEVSAFREDELVLVVPRGHSLQGRRPLPFVDALDEQWISLYAGAALLQRQQQAAMASGKTLKLRMQVRSFDAVGHMVAAGLGIALLPKQAVLPIVRALGLSWRPLADDWAKRQLVACIAPLSPPWVKAMRDFLCEVSKK